MKMCPKCNKELSEGTKFCDGCGTPIYETIFCPNCGKQTSTEYAFCQSCGASMEGKTTEEQLVVVPKEKKKIPKKVFMFGGIGMAFVAVLIIVISLFCGGGEKAKSNYALYLKDNEMFFANMKMSSEPWQLTSRLIDSDYIDGRDLSNARNRIGFNTCMSKDGKYIFFPDRIYDLNEGYNLYCKEIAKPGMEAIKIDSDIQFYFVNDSATIVTYLKGDEGDLYQYKIGENSKEKIASEVRNFKVSDDGKKIAYINNENSIYLKYADKDREKIASDVSSLSYITDDFSIVYYIKEGSLYKQVKDADKVKICSDIDNVISIYDSGEIYYVTSEVEEISLMDYVFDDMRDTDAYIVEPTYPELPDSPSRPMYWHYETDAEYDAAYAAYEAAYATWQTECERMRNEYNVARQVYNAKVSRDRLRAALQGEVFEQTNYSLCFYNGSEETIITDTFASGYNYTVAADVPVISYEAYNQSNFENVKLTEVESIYEIKNMVQAARFSSSERYVAVENKATVIEQEKDAGYFRINASGTIVYYIDDMPDDKNYGGLYRISIDDGVVGKPELYDSDVYAGHCYFVSENQFEYYKDYKENKGELYINKEKIDYDVRVDSVGVYADLNKIYYFTDWNREKEYGTLKVYQDGKTIKIADDSHSYSVTNDGQVLYLYDYSLNYYSGELYVWSNGEARKMDEEVVCLVPVFYNE